MVSGDISRRVALLALASMGVALKVYEGSLPDRHYSPTQPGSLPALTSCLIMFGRASN